MDRIGISRKSIFGIISIICRPFSAVLTARFGLSGFPFGANRGLSGSVADGRGAGVFHICGKVFNISASGERALDRADKRGGERGAELLRERGEGFGGGDGSPALGAMSLT